VGKRKEVSDTKEKKRREETRGEEDADRALTVMMECHRSDDQRGTPAHAPTDRAVQPGVDSSAETAAPRGPRRGSRTTQSARRRPLTAFAMKRNSQGRRKKIKERRTAGTGRQEKKRKGGEKKRRKQEREESQKRERRKEGSEAVRNGSRSEKLRKKRLGHGVIPPAQRMLATRPGSRPADRAGQQAIPYSRLLAHQAQAPGGRRRSPAQGRRYTARAVAVPRVKARAHLLTPMTKETVPQSTCRPGDPK